VNSPEIDLLLYSRLFPPVFLFFQLLFLPPRKAPRLSCCIFPFKLRSEGRSFKGCSYPIFFCSKRNPSNDLFSPCRALDCIFFTTNRAPISPPQWKPGGEIHGFFFPLVRNHFPPNVHAHPPTSPALPAPDPPSFCFMLRASPPISIRLTFIIFPFRTVPPNRCFFTPFVPLFLTLNPGDT